MRMNLAWIYYYRHDSPTAEKGYLEVLKIDPDFVPARQKLRHNGPARNWRKASHAIGLVEELVRERGLEPPRVLPHKILSLARLPVPPLPHRGLTY